MWSTLSNLGDAALTLPLALTCAAWLTMSSAGWRSAANWLVLLTGGAFVVGVTKVLYAGCGLEIRAIDFRVISGHTMLASAVWPATLVICLTNSRDNSTKLGFALGVLIAAMIGTARVFDNAHTVSEVVAGWCLGSLVTFTFLQMTMQPALQGRLRALAALTIFGVSAIAYGHHVPIQEAIEYYSPFLCGR
ncbi:phosphatase PAP2 family protein [Paraburkholderia sp. Tr-20389]|uniref:phosphatase PAP2 family protein n=1 Tax=Paraburkholderia sp. Tr-20389 TaxID=2703903 RepID=UPI00197D9996|nr:phosphatase PAP2 family protein [Paraburkholderia sp. Tr-20389]MBN3756914.1 phosphatase PAP2 family protein [Paraburkholderia sp. Tr-20389]